jgi:DNA-binding response OmpR family regulator
MKKPNLRIAVVEDDVDLRDNMLDFLESCGYDVWGVGNANDLYRQMLVRPVDAVILDVGLPGEDGFSVARHLRRMESLLLIIVSARTALDDRLTGLSCGADLYLTKPVDFRELEANLVAIARRLPGREEMTAQAGTPEMGVKPVIPLIPPVLPNSDGVWRLDVTHWRLVSPEGLALSLTAKEFRFVLTLAEANGETVSRSKVAASLGTPGITSASESNRIDVLVARLRKKGVQTFGAPLPIKTVTAYGYALSARCTLG